MFSGPSSSESSSAHVPANSGPGGFLTAGGGGGAGLGLGLSITLCPKSGSEIEREMAKEAAVGVC
eukprot:3340266-Rhodomonas_salina.3